MKNKYYKTTEICKYFDVTPMAVIKWIKSGKLTSYETPGGHFRVTREDLINFFEQRGHTLPDELKPESKKYRILVVDDEKNVIESVKLILEGLGVETEIETASDGFEAGMKVTRFLPDLVILDALMPGANGHRIIELIRSNDTLKHTRILVFTGYNNEAEKMIKLGADKAIIKAGPEADVYIFRKEVCKLLGVEYVKVSVNEKANVFDKIK